MDWIIWLFVALIGLRIAVGIFNFIVEMIEIFLPQHGVVSVRQAPRNAVGEFEIVYRDRGDEITRRKIKPFFRTDARDPLITAYCAMRQDVRSFKASRIMECIDLETGEVVQNLARRVPTGDDL